MAWNPKFIGGPLKINNNAELKITAYSRLGDDSFSFFESEDNVIKAWWDNRGDVCALTDKNDQIRFLMSPKVRMEDFWSHDIISPSLGDEIRARARELEEKGRSGEQQIWLRYYGED